MEGSQEIIVIVKMLEKILEILDRMRREFLERRLRKQALGLKSSFTKIADKLSVENAKNFKSSLTKREMALSDKLSKEKYNIDIYKIEKQAELEGHDKLIKKAQRAFDIAKNEFEFNRNNKEYSSVQLEKDKVNLAKLQEDINNCLEDKKEFELKVNKELLAKDVDYKKLQDTYKRLKQDLEICDKALDGFNSNFKRHISDSLREDYNNALNRENMNLVSNNIDKPEINNEKNIENEPNNKDINDNNEVLKKYIEQQKFKSMHNSLIKNREEIER